MNHGTKFCRPNVFTPIGRAGIAWVPSNKMLFFPLRYKAPLAFPQMFSRSFYSYTILSDSLSLGFKVSVDIRLQWVNKVSNSCVDSSPLSQF
jgi:hypothetical protein